MESRRAEERLRSFEREWGIIGIDKDESETGDEDLSLLSRPLSLLHVSECECEIARRIMVNVTHSILRLDCAIDHHRIL